MAPAKKADSLKFSSDTSLLKKYLAAFLDASSYYHLIQTRSGLHSNQRFLLYLRFVRQLKTNKFPVFLTLILVNAEMLPCSLSIFFSCCEVNVLSISCMVNVEPPWAKEPERRFAKHWPKNEVSQTRCDQNNESPQYFKNASITFCGI